MQPFGKSISSGLKILSGSLLSTALKTDKGSNETGSS